MKKTYTKIYTKFTKFTQATPQFAAAKGQFVNKNDKCKNEQRIILSPLQHYAITYKALIQAINNVIRKKLAGIIIWRIHKVLELQRNEYLKTKSKKLNFLTKANIKLVIDKVHIINLSAHQLTLTKKSQLGPGLGYSFLDKNKNRRKFQAANLESVCQRVDNEINQKPKEDLHEFEFIPIFLSRMLMIVKTTLIIFLNMIKILVLL